MMEKDWAGVLEKLAEDKLPEVLARAEEDHQEYVAELKLQLDGYSFYCKRHGDFLTLFVTQKNNKSKQCNVFDTKFSKTLNLSLIKTLEMKEGTGITRDRVVGFGWNILKIDDGDRGWHGCSNLLRAPRENEHYVVAPRFPIIASGRELFSEYKPSNDNGHWDRDEEHRIRFKVPNQPSPYISGTIYFDGVGHLVIPYGKGKEVYQSILEELETWEGPPIID